MCSLDDLIVYLTGGLDDDGTPASSRPRWSVRVDLAVSICDRLEPSSYSDLVKAVYGDWPVDSLDPDPALNEAFDRWSARSARRAVA